MQKLATTLPRLSVFLGAGDRAALDQVDDPVAEHLGVDAEVLLVAQALGQRLRHAADAALDRAAVLDQPGDVLPDPPQHIVRLRHGAPRSVGSSYGTSTSMSLTWMKLSPKVRGMLALTWAMTYLALAAAALTMSTDTPRLHSPLASGGVTLISATSIGIRPLSNSLGISERKIGV